MRTAILVLIAVFGTGATTAADSKTGAAPPTSYEIDLLDARPESAAEAATLLGRYASALRVDPGCLRVDLVRQPAPTANHFALLIIWRDDAGRARTTSSRAAVSFRAAFQPLAASPVDQRLYSPVKP